MKPTSEQVEAALAAADRWAQRGDEYPDFNDVTDTLATEVRTLREDNARLQLERDYANADSARWIRRVTLLEARLDKIREMLGADLRTELQIAAGHESPVDLSTLSSLQEAHRLAPPPFLAMQHWTQDAKSAAADFYQLAHDFLPVLISRWRQKH